MNFPCPTVWLYVKIDARVLINDSCQSEGERGGNVTSDEVWKKNQCHLPSMI